MKLLKKNSHKILFIIFGNISQEKLYKEIEILGGSYELDFTKKVTHLITNNPESQKYKVKYF